MTIETILSKGWQKTAITCRGKKIFWYRSPQILLLKRSLQKIIPAYAQGIVLDAGAGASDYKHMFSRCDKYLSIDLRREGASGCMADIAFLPFQEKTFDTIFCSQVLEHLPNPSLALAEFYRALKPGGSLILTVPHLSCYHELPHDYYRFTAAGISLLLRESGFTILRVQGCAGIVSFIGHMFSHIALGIGAHCRFIGGFILLLNSLIAYILAFIDTCIVPLAKNAPLNIIAVGAKGR